MTTADKSTSISVPKLNMRAIPLIPGFVSDKYEVMGKDKYNKQTIQCTERLEREQTPAPDLITHNFGPYSARVPRTTNQDLLYKPSTPAGPRTSRNGRPSGLHRAKWLSFDRDVLRFFMYYKEAVPESPLENWRIRKLVLLYFKADETVEINETKQNNSGMAQGTFLKRTPIDSLAGINGASHLKLADFAVGAEIPLFGRQFKLVDADVKTRHFFKTELGKELIAPIPYPKDPITVRSEAQAEAAQNPKGEGLRGPKPKDNLGAFLKYGERALTFKAIWDDSVSLYGDKRYFMIQFFLADDTIQIKETFKANSGREPFPKFMSRRKIFRSDGSDYDKMDFICGQNVEISGRTFQILSCDDFTKSFYSKMGVEQVPIKIVEEVKVKPRMPIPPYNGFGSEEDSLGSFYSLVPKPIRRNLDRQKKFEDQVLHIRVELLTNTPKDLTRRFDLSYHLADQSLSLFELAVRNSGIQAGRFLERGKYTNSATGKTFDEKELGACLQAAMQKRTGELAEEDHGDEIEILKHRFRIYNGDDFTLDFFNLSRTCVVEKEERIFKHIVAQLLARKLNVRELFREADKDDSKSIEESEFREMLYKCGVEVSDEELSSVLSRFRNGAMTIWYQDFCDTLARHWSPPRRNTNSRVEQIRNLLLEKLRTANTKMRVLFRNFDRDGNGVLTLDEFERLLKHYTIQVSDDELGALMIIYDRDGQGSINYNEFCDAVYECDFSSVLDNKQNVTNSQNVEQVQVEQYLAKAKSATAASK